MLFNRERKLIRRLKCPSPKRTARSIKTFRFRNLFLAGEEDEEQTSSLATVLDVLRRKWPDAELFQAREVADYAGRADEEPIAFKAALELAAGTHIKIISATAINWRLKAITDAPVMAGDKMLVLQYIKPDPSGRNGGFKVTDL